jgi:hypothetical protein
LNVMCGAGVTATLCAVVLVVGDCPFPEKKP